jgi:hypothetical protein
VPLITQAARSDHAQSLPCGRLTRETHQTVPDGDPRRARQPVCDRDPDEVEKIKALGYNVQRQAAPTEPDMGTFDFPPADSNYHNFAELDTEVDTAVSSYRASCASR